MRLRPATLADLPTLHHWDRQPHVIAASGDDAPFDWENEIPREVDWAEMLIAEEGGRPIGVMQIIDPAREETHYWVDCEENLRAIDIWIGEASDFGKGYGTQMMRLAIDRCFADPKVKAILIDPLAHNVRARRFYERLGFVPVERRTFGTDDCVVYRLGREVCNRSHENTEVPWHSAPRHYRSSCEQGRLPDTADQKPRAGTSRQVTSRSPKGS